MTKNIESHAAEITWVSPEEGGRKCLPQGKKYSTISKFEEDSQTWFKSAWSIVLEFEVPPSQQGNPSFGRARFLSPDAPIERLKVGKEFELYEGNRRTAIVKILD
jgi:hypothetical protein